MVSELIEKRKACKISINEGSASSAGSGFGDSFIVPFAEALKANAFHIGLLSAFSGLISPIAQHFGNKLMEKFSRKQIVKEFVLLQALVWIPIAVLAFISWKSIPSYFPWILIALYVLVSIFGGLAHPAWFSWMGDIVPENHRGKYFSRRNLITGIIGIVAAILGSLLIKQFKITGLTFIGFGILFFLSFAFRFTSFSYFKKQYDPKFKLNKKSEFSLVDFIKRFDNYGKFAVYQAFFNFAISIASPFFSFYLLKELGYNQNLFLFMIISMSSSVFTLMFYPLAGKLSDKYGNLSLLYIANIFFILSPLVWLFSQNLYWLILVPGIVAGIANAAYSIGTTNFTYDSISHPEKRGTCIAHTNLLVGIGVFLGSILGGLLLKYFSSIQLAFNAFFIIFILGALARLVVAIYFLPKLEEVKSVKKLAIHIHPFKIFHHEFHGLGLFTGQHHNIRAQISP